MPTWRSPSRQTTTVVWRFGIAAGVDELGSSVVERQQLAFEAQDRTGAGALDAGARECARCAPRFPAAARRGDCRFQRGGSPGWPARFSSPRPSSVSEERLTLAFWAIAPGLRIRAISPLPRMVAPA